jgi:hypothetical protein
VSLCAPNHTQLLEVHKRLPGRKFVGANIWEIVVFRQFAPQPIEHAAAVSARPFTIY